MTRSRTPPSTPRLSEVARHVVIPKGIATTAWPRAEAKCAELGVRFDRWQQGAGAIILGKRKDGMYAATVGGVVLSIPRQVGKTFLVGMIVIALCLLHPNLTVVWTAHRMRTSTKTFHTMKAMTSRAKVKPHMLEPRTANGEQEIRFRNGSVIMFGAREQGFGRGFDKVDIAVFDEAQILSEKGVEDIVPATNQAEMDGGALLFFMGTPPRPTDPGAEFTNRRVEALSGKSEDMVYIEFSADDDADPDDRKQWAKANPSFPSRTPVQSIQRMRKNLTDKDSFLREGLGVWGRSGAKLLDGFAKVRSRTTAPGPRVSFAVHVTPDRSMAAVAVASRRSDGVIHLELVWHRPGVSWITPTMTTAVKKHKAQHLVIAGGLAAGALAADLEKLRGYKSLSNIEVRRACAGLYDLINAKGQPQVEVRITDAKLNKAVNDAVTAVRRSSERGEWVFAADADVDLSPLYALALAAHVVRSTKPATYSVADSLY